MLILIECTQPLLLAHPSPHPLPPPLHHHLLNPLPPSSFSAAGFAYKGNVFGADECATTLGVNFHGTAAVTEALLPLIPQGGRIINMCSGGYRPAREAASCG